MILKFKYIRLKLMVLLLVVACNNGPKVIAPSAEHAGSEKGSGVFSQKPLTQVDPDNTTSLNKDLHTVVVTEILPTSRYVSLIHISEPTRRTPISYAVFCLKKKTQN